MLPKTQWSITPQSNPNSIQNLTFLSDYSIISFLYDFWCSQQIAPTTAILYLDTVLPLLQHTHSHNILNTIYSTWHCKSKHYHHHSAALSATCLQSHVNLRLGFLNSKIHHFRGLEPHNTTWCVPVKKQEHGEAASKYYSVEISMEKQCIDIIIFIHDQKSKQNTCVTWV